MALEEIGEKIVDGMERGTLLWRFAVTGSCAGFACYVAWSFGLIGFLGSGFAHADDVRDLKNQVADVRASLIAEKIDAVTTSLCMERYDANLLAFRDNLQKEYHDVTGHDHQSPPCEILIKLQRK